MFQAGLVPLALAIVRDGRVLAAGGDDGKVRLWGLPEGRQMSRLAAHVGLVMRLATLPSAVVADAAGGQPATGVLVTAGDDGHVRLWALPSGQQIRTLGPPARLVSAVTCMAVSADGRSIASGTLAGRVDLWNAKERVKQIKSAEGTAVNCLAFLDGGESLAVGSADGTIRVVACPGGRRSRCWACAATR